MTIPAEQSRTEVAAYYFPGYHADPRIDARKGKGWTEWDLIRAAKQRFEASGEGACCWAVSSAAVDASLQLLASGFSIAWCSVGGHQRDSLGA